MTSFALKFTLSDINIAALAFFVQRTLSLHVYSAFLLGSIQVFLFLWVVFFLQNINLWFLIAVFRLHKGAWYPWQGQERNGRFTKSRSLWAWAEEGHPKSAQGSFHSDITSLLNPINLRNIGSKLQHSWLTNLNIYKLLSQQNQCMAVTLDSDAVWMQRSHWISKFVFSFASHSCLLGIFTKTRQQHHQNQKVNSLSYL